MDDRTLAGVGSHCALPTESLLERLGFGPRARLEETLSLRSERGPHSCLREALALEDGEDLREP